MGGYLWAVGLALLVAVGVLVMASASSDNGTDLRTFFGDLRSGLRRRPRGEREDAAEQTAADNAEPVDVPFAQLFAEEAQPDDGYLQLDELADLIERTGERAGRLLHSRGGGPIEPSRTQEP